jgi:hypothetical protein
MKAPIAQAGEEGATSPGCSFFFLGPRNRKMNFINSDFGCEWSFFGTFG